MKVTKKIATKLAEIPEGIVFGYQDMDIESCEFGAAAKTLSTLVAKGVLQRASKGVFFKPRQTVFGLLKPNDYELLKPYLFKNKQRVAYVTGIGLYNQMGLTTQVPFVVTIATTIRRNRISFDRISIKPAKSYVTVTESNYILLGILDAIKDFNAIPDVDRKGGLRLLTSRIKELDAEQTQELITCALQYPPRVRALVGALAENAGKTTVLDALRNSLNPLSSYKWRFSSAILPTISKWKIK